MSADDNRKKPPRASRRRKRGHSKSSPSPAGEAHAAAPKKRAVKTSKQLDREAFGQVDRMIGSFAQRRFGPMMAPVAKGFFGNAKDKAETELPELQQAFALYFVYGYRDGQGQRIIDMFKRFGLQLDREQSRVLKALERTRLVVFGLESKNDANKQLAGRDILRGLPMTALDHNVFAKVSPGDVLVAYMFPVGDLWRPLGMATLVGRVKVGALRNSLSKLASDQGFSPQQLADRRPAQVFWLAYRAAELIVRSKA